MRTHAGESKRQSRARGTATTNAVQGAARRRARPSGIMEISGTGKQEAVSALVARIRAKARAKRASHLKFFGILRDGAVTGKAQRKQKESGKGSSSTSSPNKRMIGCNKAEAARGHLGTNGKRVSSGRVRQEFDRLLTSWMPLVSRFSAVYPCTGTRGGHSSTKLLVRRGKHTLAKRAGGHSACASTGMVKAIAQALTMRFGGMDGMQWLWRSCGKGQRKSWMQWRTI